MIEPVHPDPIAEAGRQWIKHGWADAADGMTAITAIMRTQQILLSRIEKALKPFGLTFSRYELLTLLSFTRSGALPMAKASARLQVHPTSVTNAVDRLESAGFVKRLPHPTDGRGTLVEITDDGRAIAAQATAALNATVFENPGFEQPELDSLIGMLGRFRRDAGDFGQPEPATHD
ncbi:MarR family transcriptional regulator [Salinibacterium sp. G-O1]|uniref:MarR family winged helix-turn-helix transcriptional regulator n=1 Tax=Salinibacterium sp. G-O1 TaxID=3046208 RepID=UPI0024BBDF1E|nr:MarR family transcriptional regulator [Salinibacterium sp. G-O1]MDJ0333953.1 MarR family transcriptional regulator [Salinibacterium sp. G-O1]